MSVELERMIVSAMQKGQISTQFSRSGVNVLVEGDAIALLEQAAVKMIDNPAHSNGKVVSLNSFVESLGKTSLPVVELQEQHKDITSRIELFNPTPPRSGRWRG